jgi:hypothetical protein
MSETVDRYIAQAEAQDSGFRVSVAFEPEQAEITLGEQVQFVVAHIQQAVDSIIATLEDDLDTISGLAVRRLVENHVKFRDQNWRSDSERNMLQDEFEELADAIVYECMRMYRDGVR